MNVNSYYFRKNRGKLFACVLGLVVLVIIFATLSSCEKVDNPNFGQVNPPGDAQIELTIPSDGTVKSFLYNDTIWAERNLPVNFKAEATGITITSWSWVFNGAAVISGEQVVYSFASIINPQSLHLVGFYGNNQQITKDFVIIVVEDISTLDPVKLISCQDLGGGLYSVTFGISKSRTRSISGASTFFFTGNMTSPPWTAQLIPVGDTSYNIANGPAPNYAPILVIPPVGDNGYCYAIKNLNSIAGSYDLGTGKIKNNQQLWLDFTGSIWADLANPTLIKYTILPGGTVVPNITPPAELPGAIGDEGENAVLRFELGTDGATIFLHNSVDFNGQQFLKFYNESNIANAPVLQTAVTGFPKWGKYYLPYSSSVIQPGGIIALKFGNQASSPNVYNANAHLSMYYDELYWYLRFGLDEVGAMKSGEIKSLPQLRRLSPSD